MRVKDATGTTTFVLFEKDCDKLFAKIAIELIKFDVHQQSHIMNVIFREITIYNPLQPYLQSFYDNKVASNNELHYWKDLHLPTKG